MDRKQQIAKLRAELADLLVEDIMEASDDEIRMDPGYRIKTYLDRRDDALLGCDGPARDTHEGCERALRDVYLIACGGKPENNAEWDCH